jgi:hypothetical protein
MQHKQSEVLFGRAMDVLVEGCSSASRGPMNYKPVSALYSRRTGIPGLGCRWK